ncbi:hypothetical protein PG994_014431 [Apiospora phragmitis]|uniref:Erythromycin biosynthesis protein CIII-like C-terminal domain-containing protein n=1 Tax=Apiospora phragmitis TaxID=2905665 RepID=A0ABR1T4B2_9PEZI
MARPFFTAVAVLAASLAVLLAAFGFRNESEDRVVTDYVRGKNNTVLFLTNSEYGLSNVHVATAQSLLENHPHVRVHFASFPRMSGRIARVSSLARLQNASAPNITFHELKGQSYAAAVEEKAGFVNLSSRWFEHWPGLSAYPRMGTIIQGLVAPWGRDAYLALLGSDMPFPVPWSRIPENIYLASRFIYSVYIASQRRSSTSLPRKHGEPRTSQARDGKEIFIAPHIPGSTLPLNAISKSTIGTNSIVLRSAAAAQQDPELANWLKRAPTLLVNLGSIYKYTEESASIMAQAIQVVLGQTKVSGTSLVQVLWKHSPDYEYGNDFSASLEGYIAEDRVRISSWLPIDTMAMLETGRIVASVHHGGANSYHEALSGGVPHVVVPMWVDLYNYAMLAELTGVGIYATRGTAPHWSVEGLSKAFLGVVNGPKSASMREKAQHIAQLMRKEPGSHQAAKAIAELAAQGLVPP